MKLIKTLAATGVAATLACAPAFAENRIDTQRADAPELAAYGALPVGVRQIDLTNPNQIDVVKVDPAAEKPAEMPMYDRPLTVEVWYPAADGAEGSTTLKAFLRDGKTTVELEGRAMRDAAPRSGETYPLVMISHGYPGNRFPAVPSGGEPCVERLRGRFHRPHRIRPTTTSSRSVPPW